MNRSEETDGSSQEVRDAVGEAPPRDEEKQVALLDVTSTRELEQRAAELRATLSAPTEKERAQLELEQVERTIREKREAGHRKAAGRRMVGIARAYGSLAAQLERDKQELLRRAQQLRASVTEANDRARSLAVLAAEAGALNARFGTPLAALPPYVPAGRDARTARVLNELPTLTDFVWIVPTTEECRHRMRRRRTFVEVAGTPTSAIIEQAGLADFPALTDQQLKIVATRAAERERTARGLGRIAEEVRVTKLGEAMPPGAHHG